ncbi:hypothetical protein [Ancylobacter radicis]|uniref:Histone H1 n=1 Tax=Ancylobacter radicis TaxID=2836179 RepID=A0ABS5R4T2_9HYPH|nr:hypothetical protein [Ancylobacter radicis]MBS9476685.1 hypothetical protein [Ancylobacter radicis]
MTHEERNQEILKAIKEVTERVNVSKKAARDFLIQGGIYTKKGKLRAEFGGVRPKKNPESA